MEPITYQEFQEMIRESTRAFHLELRDVYQVEEEAVPIEKWLKGEPDDFAWRTEWLTFIENATTTAGVKVERVRVVSEPHSYYVQWALSLDPQNIAAGEDVRYLPRRDAEGIHLPDEDCWLFDNERLVLSLFKPDGGSGGFACEDDPELIKQYRVACDQVWSRAVAYSEYITR